MFVSRFTRWCTLGLAGLILACGTGLAADERHEDATQALGADRFVAGGEIVVRRPVEGDLLVTGGHLAVDATVAGDLLAFGGQVRLSNDVGGSVLGAAGQTTIEGKVGRNVRVAGGRLELGPKSEVGGNVSAGVGQLRLRGSVRGHVLVGGGRVLIDGPVGGDVVVGGGALELGPAARITGQLRYRSGSALKQDPGAQVGGGIERLSPFGGHDARNVAGRAARGGAVVVGIVWTIGMVVLAGMLIGLVPAFCDAVARSMRERLGTSLLLGFAVLVCVPIAAALLMATLIGIPLGLVTLALYAALLPVAYVVAAIGVADGALRRWQPQRADRRSLRFVAAAVLLLVLPLLGLVPVLGWLLGLAMLLAGLGAVVLQLRRAPAAV